MLGTLPLAALFGLWSVGCAAAPKHAIPAGPAPFETAPPAASENEPTAVPAEAPAESAQPAEAAPPAGAVPAPQSPVREGAWHVAGGSNAAFTNSEVGDQETTTFGIEVSAGRMVSPNMLFEGLFEISDTSTEAGGAEFDQSVFLLGAALRYYFTVEGKTLPYGRVLGGITFVDAEFGGGGDDDTSPFLGIGLGAETFLATHLALDYGFRLLYAFDVFDDELTEIGLFLGLSIWL
jgi:hypothetical protein